MRIRLVTLGLVCCAFGSSGCGDGTDDEIVVVDETIGVEDAINCDVPTDGLVSYTHTLQASGLGGYEGETIYVKTSVQVGRDGVCWSAAHGTIVDGIFSVTITNLRGSNVYPQGGEFIDRNNNGSCDAATEPSTWGQVILDSIKIVDGSVVNTFNPDDGCLHLKQI